MSQGTTTSSYEKLGHLEHSKTSGKDFGWEQIQENASRKPVRNVLARKLSMVAL